MNSSCKTIVKVHGIWNFRTTMYMCTYLFIHGYIYMKIFLDFWILFKKFCHYYYECQCAHVYEVYMGAYARHECRVHRTRVRSWFSLWPFLEFQETNSDCQAYMVSALGVELSHCPSPPTVYSHIKLSKLQFKFSIHLAIGKTISLITIHTLVTVQQGSSKLLVIQERWEIKISLWGQFSSLTG